MKTLIIYYSKHHENTQKVAEAMADSIGADVLNYELVDPDNIYKYQVVGFGSGIYHGEPGKELVEFIKNLKKMENKKAFVFTTSGQGKASFNDSLKQLLGEKDFEVIGQFTCKGFDTYGLLKIIGGINKGRPNEDDLKKAKLFAENLKG
jgi:flavodoxin